MLLRSLKFWGDRLNITGGVNEKVMRSSRVFTMFLPQTGVVHEIVAWWGSALGGKTGQLVFRRC